MSIVCTEQPRTYSRRSHQRFLHREFIRLRTAWADSHDGCVARLQSLHDRTHNATSCECAASLLDIISTLRLIDRHMKNAFIMLRTMSEKVDFIYQAQSWLCDLRIEDLESHLCREMEIQDHLDADYHRFVRGRLSEDCSCEGCRLTGKLPVLMDCDCRPSGPRVAYTVKRELDDGKCCESCHHVATAVGCECSDCMGEKDLHEKHADIAKARSECCDIQERLFALGIEGIEDAKDVEDVV